MKPLTIKLVRNAPELAVIDVLSRVLETTIAALVAADHGIFCEPPPLWIPIPKKTRIAERIVELARQLLEALDDYQHAVELTLERQRERELRGAEDEDIPF